MSGHSPGTSSSLRVSSDASEATTHVEDTRSQFKQRYSRTASPSSASGSAMGADALGVSIDRRQSMANYGSKEAHRKHQTQSLLQNMSLVRNCGGYAM